MPTDAHYRYRILSDRNVSIYLDVEIYSSFLVFMARDSKALKMVCGVSVSSSFAFAQMGGGTYSMGFVLPKTQLKVLKEKIYIFKMFDS